MKFDCGKTPEEVDAELKEWHLWCAWHPVSLGSHDCRWLETVQRKGTCQVEPFWSWEYKEL